jgi:hypothetical protein
MKLKPFLLVAALLAWLPSANATIIDLGQTIGSPASPANEVARLNGQIDIYNLANSTSLTYATLIGSPGQVMAGGTSISLDVTGWSYLMLKWADTDQFYYVGSDVGTFTFNSTVFNRNQQPQGLSHYEFFNPNSVPDGGSTAMMLGAALSGLSLVVRRLKA